MKQIVTFITHWFTGLYQYTSSFCGTNNRFSCLYNTVQFISFNSLINSEGSEYTRKQTIVSNIKFIKENSPGIFILLWSIL